MLSDLWARHKDSLLWCALLLVCLFVVRLIFLEAPAHRGDTNYMVIAADYSPELVRQAPDQICFRLGMILPFILLEHVFGFTLTTYYLFSLGAYALVICGVFLVSRAVGGLTAAVVATSLVGTSALFLSRSSNPFPDTPNLVFLLLSFALFLRAVRVETGSSRAIAAAATCAFVAYLFRAPNLVWLTCIPIYEALQTRSLRRSLLFAAAFASLLALECVYYLALIGDPLARFGRVFGAVGSWSGNMPFISPRAYLLEPATELLASSTGWVLLFGGAAGLLLAWRKRNWAMCSLVVGGLVLFLAYSYAVTSVDPLRRALPLLPRYIMAFTAVLATSTGYLLAHLRQWVDARASGSALRWLPHLVVGFLLVLQVHDLPGTIGRGAKLFRNDHFRLADRALQARTAPGLRGAVVHAMPRRAFGLYPGFSALNLEEMPLLQPPEWGQTLLYSRRYLRRQLASATLPHRTSDPAWRRKARWLQYHLQYPPPPHWHSIVDTSDIVMVRVGQTPPPGSFVLDLTDPGLRDTAWTATGEDGQTPLATVRSEGASLAFDVASTHTRWAHFDSSPRPWNPPKRASTGAPEDLRAHSTVSCDIQYSLGHNVRALTMTLVERAPGRTLSSTTHFLPTGRGRHELIRPIVLNDDTVAIRAAMKIATDLDTTLTIDRLRLSLPPDGVSRSAPTEPDRGALAHDQPPPEDSAAGDLVLARTGSPLHRQGALLDLTALPFGPEIWSARELDDGPGVALGPDGTRGLRFQISPGQPRFYYTFPGRWVKPVEGWSEAFWPVCRRSELDCTLTYELTEEVTSLALTMAEYDERSGLSLKTSFLPTRKGVHRVEERMALSEGAWSLRFAVRVASERGAELTFYQFDVGDSKRPHTVPSSASNSGGE